MENIYEKFNIPCVILAGGKSSRFGKDKALFFAKKQYKYMNQFFEKVYISTNIDKFDFECELILDSSDIKAPIFALNDILEKFDEVFIISVDTFGVKFDIIRKLIQSRKVCIKNPLVGFYDKSLLNKIKINIKNRNYKIFNIQKSLDLNIDLLNINYYDEYEKYKGKL